MTNYIKLLKTLCEPANDIEDALINLYVAFILDNAQGIALDIIGDRVGQKREGLDEITYRQAIKARIFVNRSTGSFHDVKRVVRAFSERPVIESGGGVALIRVGKLDLATVQLLFRLTAKAIEVTVRLQLHYLTAAEVESFTYAAAAVSTGLISGGTVDVLGAANLPDFGSVYVGVGTPLYELATYTNRTATQLQGLTTVNNHPIGTAFQRTNNPTQGYGDGITPAIGGKFAGLIGS